MRYSPRFTYTLTPGNSTLDLSAASNSFNIRGLLGVLDTTANVILYAASIPGYGYSALSGGNILTLQVPMTGISASDSLVFIYDDGNIGITSGSLAIGARPDGFLNVRQDPTTIFQDTFDTFDTTNKWTTGGTAPTLAAGSLNIAPGTATGALSYLQSQPKFVYASAAYAQFIGVMTLESGVLTGNQRFWGLGVYTTPTVSAPITNGVIFEIDNGSGALFASVYSGGSRTQTTTLTRPSDGLPHRYTISFRTSRVYYEIDTATVASFGFPNTAVSTLGVVAGSVNGGSATASAPVLNTTVLSITDTSKSTMQIVDGLYPWRENTVKPASVAALSTDTSLVVALNPNTPVTLPTITKGTQAATGISVQNLRDAGRTSWIMSAESVAGIATTDTLITYSYALSYGTPVTGVTSYTVPAGKTLRINTLTLTYVSTTTTANTARIRLRINTAGAAVIGSPSVWFTRIGWSSATFAANQTQTVFIPFTEGLEIPAGAGVAFSHYELAANGTLDIAITGYLY